MGIYDREYYRNEGPSFLGSLAAHGRVCKWLIIVNVGVYILQLLTSSPMEVSGGLVTDAFRLDVTAVMHGQVWRLLTYAFLHSADPWHIIFNMLFLWWFGTDVEDLYGPKEFLGFYLLSAFVGGLAFQLGWLLGVTPPTAVYCIGASGAVMAVLVVCACHYPTRVIYLFMLLPVPIWLFVAFMAFRDFVSVLGGSPGNTAFTVHLGGAAFGFLYHWNNWRVLNWLPNLGSLQRQRARPNLRVYRDEEPASPVPVVSAAPPADVDEQMEAKVDALLEKVARVGKNNLTASEQEFLMRASEIYRKRRS